MIDPLLAINLSRINAGMVFIIGDDPGAYGSQNDQDSRPFALQLEMPWLEPSHPSQAFNLTVLAFDWSEKFQIPVFIRITRGFSEMKEVSSGKKEFKNTQQKKMLFSKAYSNSPLIDSISCY